MINLIDFLHDKVKAQALRIIVRKRALIVYLKVYKQDFDHSALK